jgi:hypothetical protein
MKDMARLRIALAVRILEQQVSRYPHDPEDVRILRSWADSPAEMQLSVDELACMIIQRERRSLASYLSLAPEQPCLTWLQARRELENRS